MKLLKLFGSMTLQKLIKVKKMKKIIGGPVDYGLVLTIIFLNIYGIIMIYSASYYEAVNSLKESSSLFLIKQLVFFVVGIAVMLVISFLNYHVIFEIPGFVWFLFSFALMLLLCLGFGVTNLGATRWLKFGPIQFQAAEPLKACMIVFLAIYLSQKKFTAVRQLELCALTAVICLLVYKISDNLSTAIIVFAIYFILALITTDSKKIYIIITICILVFAAVFLLAIIFIVPYDSGESFRLGRIRAWIHPELYPDKAFQAIQAKYAIGSGGFWGKGLGQSLIKFKMPETYNDFIFAILCEELGVAGVIIMMLLFGYLFYRLADIAKNAVDLAGKIYVTGVFIHIALQMILNVMVVVGLFPTTGVTLPFFSYGGASVVFTLCELAVVLNVDKYTKHVKATYEARKIVEEEGQKRNN